MAWRPLLAVLICLAGCRDWGGEWSAGAGDGGAAGDAGVADATAPGETGAGPSDGAPESGAGPGDGGPEAGPGDGGPTPQDSCRPLALACLSAGDPAVLEVPTELSAADAFAQVQVGQTIQMNGVALGSGWRVPAWVTLRGCNGATIVGAIAFAGSGGTVEGFEVSGAIVANQTGSYVVRYNRFVGESAEITTSEAGVSARSIDALVGADVTATIESNWFQDRRLGVWLATRYDTLQHRVTATVRNNVFRHVESPVTVDETGLVGMIAATIDFNTLHDFDAALSFNGVTAPVSTAGNLFFLGRLAVSSNSPFEVDYSLVAAVPDPPFTGALVSGSFAVTDDPGFVAADAGDYRLLATSPAADRVPGGVAVPSLDYYGCPRPAADGSAAPMADIGALERQP
jgi:hypothetical protein